MNKILAVGAVLVALVLAVGVAGYAYAQAPTPPPNPWGRGGMMGGYGGGMMGGRGGMMGGYGGYGAGMMAGGYYNSMHSYMVAAVAKALGMTTDDLNAALTSGKTMWQVAQEKGKTADEFQKIMVDARKTALDQMVADGVITQAQADAMLARMQNMPMWGGANGPGGCPMGGSGRGGRWNTGPQTTPSVSY